MILVPTGCISLSVLIFSIPTTKSYYALLTASKGFSSPQLQTLPQTGFKGLGYTLSVLSKQWPHSSVPRYVVGKVLYRNSTDRTLV